MGQRSIVDKLDRFDRHADHALTRVVQMIEEMRDEIVTVARARHITGHFVHHDGELFEYDAGRLDKETLEELADAVVYQARRLDL